MVASPVVQSQGLHHITLNGADKKTSIDFWEGVLGMPFIFEQPNLDNPDENHLYFDPGDSRLITIFTDEKRSPDKSKVGTKIGSVHHIAFDVSDIESEISRLIENGFELIHKSAKSGADNKLIAFLHPKSTSGVLIEMCQEKSS